MRTGVSQNRFGGGERYMGMKKGRTASFRPLPTGEGPIFVHRIPENVQLSPVVQPIAMVPYSSQDNPLMTYEEERRNPVAEAAPAEEKRGVKSAPIVRILMCLLTVAVYVAGNFFLSDILALSGTEAEGSGLGMILSLFQSSGGFDLLNMLPKILILAALVGVVVTLVVSVVKITKKTHVVVKISAFLASLCALVALLMQIIFGGVGIGMYIVTALCLVSLLTAFLVKSK